MKVCLRDELARAHTHVAKLNKQFFGKLLELQTQFQSGQEGQKVRAFSKLSSMIRENRRKSFRARDYDAVTQIQLLVEYLSRRYDAVGLNVMTECQRVIEQGFVNSTSISFYFDDQAKQAIWTVLREDASESSQT